MDLRVKSDDQQVMELVLSGGVTQLRLGQARDPLAAALGEEVFARKILLDLSGTNAIDSSGINWLLTSHRKAREAGGRLVLHSLPQLVDNVLKVLRMDLVFEVAASEADARALVAG